MAVSIRLIVEIMDGYHGPPKQKLWLLAWAERAAFDTRTGWCPRPVLAARAGVSESTASRIATALVNAGVIKRVRAPYPGHSAVYSLSALGGHGTRAPMAARVNGQDACSHRSTRAGTPTRADVQHASGG